MGVNTSGEPPYVFPKPNHLVTTDGEIEVSPTRSAGEVEFVLYPTDEAVYVGFGFDHKDLGIANE